MTISVFDLFSIGIGPSSSHTVGRPMRAIRTFLLTLPDIEQVHRITIDLYGSLALTGKGHGTDIAILMGLEGHTPEDIDPDYITSRCDEIRNTQKIKLLNEWDLPFIEQDDFIWHKDKFLPFHPNAMRFKAMYEDNTIIKESIFYSIGGGFFLSHEDIEKQDISLNQESIPYPFSSCDELIQICNKHNLTIAELMLENEKASRTEEEIDQYLEKIWSVMKLSVENGCKNEGLLPGGLNVKRRAPKLYRHLIEEEKKEHSDPSSIMDWASLFALAVNEENAAGGKVVTAPTNGAAGVIPAVMLYYDKFISDKPKNWRRTFFLTAAAIGILYKKNASISAAEMGCQGEIGVACSMAAGALAALMNGTNIQVEIAAEIGMEHNLGLTCDPIMGLVQIPCIERNTMGTIKAINAARLAVKRDGTSHIVSLDQVIATMYQTGKDMQAIYKETSEGGLAVNVIEC